MREISTCALVGQRPGSFSFGSDEDAADCVKLKILMTAQVECLVRQGVTHYLTGLGQGADLWGAEIVLRLQKQYPAVHLTAVLPHPPQADRWRTAQRRRYEALLNQCSEVTCLSGCYASGSTRRRDRWLVDHAGYLLAVYNGSRQGSTAYMVRYAMDQNHSVVIIDPDRLTVARPSVPPAAAAL